MVCGTYCTGNACSPFHMDGLRDDARNADSRSGVSSCGFLLDPENGFGESGLDAARAAKAAHNEGNMAFAHAEIACDRNLDAAVNARAPRKFDGVKILSR